MGSPKAASSDEIGLEMTKDYHADVEVNNPAFFLHLGDVIYGHEKETFTAMNSIARTIRARSWQSRATMTERYLPRPTQLP